jgi:hypothetical protein
VGEHDPDSLDYYYGPAGWVGDVRRQPPNLNQLRTESVRLAQELERLELHHPEECRRKNFLLRQLQALTTRIDLLSGKRFTFDEEARLLFGVTAVSYPAGPYSKLGALLGGKDHLARRYARFDERFLIPPDRLPAVMQKAIEACQAVTASHVQLPPSQRIRVEYVHDRPWSGYSYYLGNYRSRIEINADFRLTVDRALDLACHETYPGHHATTVLEDATLVHQKHWFEMTVQPAFSPQSLITEGLASYAANLAFPPAERLRFERDELFPLAGLDPKQAEKYLQVEGLVDRLRGAELSVARQYLDGQLEFVRAGFALETQALMAHTEATLKYLNEYRTYVTTYTMGRDLVANYLSTGPNDSLDARWRRFSELVCNPDRRWGVNRDGTVLDRTRTE